MNCCLCKHGETRPGLVTVTLERDGCIVLVKEVPAEVCNNCGEYYTDEATTNTLLARAEQAVQSHAVLQVIHYAA